MKKGKYLLFVLLLSALLLTLTLANGEITAGIVSTAYALAGLPSA